MIHTKLIFKFWMSAEASIWDGDKMSGPIISGKFHKGVRGREGNESDGPIHLQTVHGAFPPFHSI